MPRPTPSEAKHGEKTIRLKIAFFTTSLNNKKHAWDTGFVYVTTNRHRGIRCDERAGTAFQNIEGIMDAIKKELEKYDITLVREDPRTKKMFVVE